MTAVATPPTKKPNEVIESGVYVCAKCESALFSSARAVQSCAHNCSFDAELHEGAVRYHSVHEHGLDRIDVYCEACGALVGNVFVNEPTSTGKRFCVRENNVHYQPTYE